MTRGAQTHPHPDAALLPPVRQSVARDLHAPTAVAAPGPMLTLCLPAVASGHPLNAKAGGVSSALRPLFSSLHSLCVIQPALNKRGGFQSHPKSNTSQASTAFNVCHPVVFNGSANQADCAPKIAIGGFHSSVSFVSPPALEAFT